MGVLMIALPQLAVLRFAHVHVLLLGWVSMMIYGVAYHVLPRFTGNVVYSRRLAWWHLGLVNIGLVGLAVFGALAGSPHNPEWRIPLLAAALVEAFGIVVFVFNIAMSTRRHDVAGGAPGCAAPAARRIS